MHCHACAAPVAAARPLLANNQERGFVLAELVEEHSQEGYTDVSVVLNLTTNASASTTDNPVGLRETETDIPAAPVS